MATVLYAYQQASPLGVLSENNGVTAMGSKQTVPDRQQHTASGGLDMFAEEDQAAPALCRASSSFQAPMQLCDDRRGRNKCKFSILMQIMVNGMPWDTQN